MFCWNKSNIWFEYRQDNRTSPLLHVISDSKNVERHETDKGHRVHYLIVIKSH